MKTIIEKVIDNKLAQLILDADLTVKVVYDNICINSSAGNTWNNLNGSGLEEAYLDMLVFSYIRVSNVDLDKLCEELD